MKRVYFIKPIGMDGPIKIGFSIMPTKRRDNLAAWSPFALEIVAEIDGDRLLEWRFHAKFFESHQRNEWFAATPELLADIKAINAGTFDIDALPPPRCLYERKRHRTPEFRRQQSYSLRVSHMQSRSGFSAPVSTYGIVERGDTDSIKLIEQYLRDPASVGHPIEAPWAENARRSYRSTQPTGAAA